MKKTTLISNCLCSDQKQKFKTKLVFNSKVFLQYKGTVIGECQNCHIFKTIIVSKNFEPQSSRYQMYENTAKDLMRELQPIVDQIIIHSSKSVLDVGCSSGIFVSELQKKGIKNAWGLEPNINAYRMALTKKIKNIHNLTLQDFVKKNPKQRFDAIVYNHVMEHVENPDKEIGLIKQIINKNGLLIIGVPNRRNILFYLRGIYWESLMPGEHIWHFTDSYMINLLKKKGLVIKMVFYSNHNRQQLPRIKRLYFKVLTTINKLLKTGEAVTVIAQKK